MIRSRYTLQAIALVNATAGLMRRSWSVGEMLVCELSESRAVLIALVILCRQINVERLDCHQDNTAPYP